MKLRNLLIYLLLPSLLFLSPYLPTLQAAACFQYENQLIERLDIQIQTPSDKDSSIIKAATSHLKTTCGGFFSQADFDIDLKNLVKDFDRVEPCIEIINGKLHITLKVWQKPTIRSITWCGNHRIATKDLQSELAIKCYAIFDRLSFNKAFHKLKAYYVKEGFFEADLTYDTLVDYTTNEVDIQITITEGRAGVIDKIRFCGFTACEEEEILDLMLTKEYNFLFSWYTHEGIYNEEAAQQDLHLIVNYLQNKGYADAKVDISIKEKCKNKIELIISACKGELYRFGEICFEGNQLFGNADIQRLFSFGCGHPYSVEKIRQTISRITDLYGRRGYIDAAVDFEPALCLDSLSYSVKMKIEEGRQYRVGLIKVFGNCTTQASVILHESLLIPGQIFNADRLKKTEQKLQNVGYFEEVNVYAVKSEGPMGLGDHYRDVHIEVKETSTGHFGAFAGYSTTESLFGGINITERNFNYKGLGSAWRNGLCCLRGGGEYAHATLQVGLKSRKYVLSWAKPFFMDTKWTLGFDIEQSNNRYISTNYQINSTALITHANYRYNDFMRVGWHYRLKNSDVDMDKKQRRRIAKAKEESQQENQHAHDQKKNKEEIEEIDGLVSATGLSFTYDSCDHPVTPRSGFRSNLELEYAGLGGDFKFFSVAYINSYFLPLGKKNILRYRADFRFILPVGKTTAFDIPLDERLFLGGDTMVRGYRSYRLGPYFKESKNPKGGISLQYYSVEFARRFHERLEAFGFFDAGYLSLDRLEVGPPFCAVGLGARLKIMENIPSLTIGYGVPLNPQNNSQVKRFFISIGGKF